MPALDELAAIYENRSQIGDFPSNPSNYFSNAQGNRPPMAVSIDFANNGNIMDIRKSTELNCRCVRR